LEVWWVILTSVISTCSGVAPHSLRKLRLGALLVGHQVEQADFQRPDVLPHRLVLGHHHHAFFFKLGACGQVVRNLDRHG
jgi:hypothetical protein